MKLSEILHGKLMLQRPNDVLPEAHKGGIEDNIIHVEKQIGCVRSTTKYEQTGVGLGLHKTKSQEERDKPAVPCTRGLLQAIQGFVETAYETGVSRVLKSGGL
jgi:hypothetical protein